ncbi:MAG TPA: hypothetical protein DEB06_02195 [Phycisphaerales bacterium]|nr:hypothetical protein [Phycisphaerales bacterium]
MTADRPTFHEAWHRVAALRPRLRGAVRVERQHYRGRAWWVVSDPATNRFFRMNRPAWGFIGLLDGSRTVEQAWAIATDAHADDAPTQGEAIALLAHLHTSNLLAGAVPPDAESLLRRRRQRVEREWRARFEQFLSVRLPLIDPNRALGAAARFAGWIVSPWGLVAWGALVALGLLSLAGRGESMARAAQAALSPGNLASLYAATVLAKLIHELAHALACRTLGRRDATGGEVHALGLMFFALVPLPYVDATSAWGLRRKRDRVLVGAAGMIAEVALASAAAIVWASSAEGSTLSRFAWNTMFVAGVSTVVFNANPLLRYDGYYILCDLLETPNLQQRARDALYSFVKRRLWGLGRPPPADGSVRERAGLMAYALASGAYRWFVAGAIVVMISGQLLIVGAALAAAAVVLWGIVPLLRFIAYLAAEPEIERVRPRAIALTLLSAVVVAALVGAVPAPRSVTIDGLAQSTVNTPVATGAEGQLLWVCPPGSVATGDPLLHLASPEGDAAVRVAAARLEGAQARLTAARAADPAIAQVEQIRASTELARLDDAQARASARRHPAPAPGEWVWDRDNAPVGAHLPRGVVVGRVVGRGAAEVRCRAEQHAASEFAQRIGAPVRVRTPAQPGAEATGTISAVTPIEPGAADPAAESRRAFEVRITLASPAALRHGQRCATRLTLDPEPLGHRWWRGALRLFQRRSEG